MDIKVPISRQLPIKFLNHKSWQLRIQRINVLFQNIQTLAEFFALAQLILNMCSQIMVLSNFVIEYV